VTEKDDKNEVVEVEYEQMMEVEGSKDPKRRPDDALQYSSFDDGIRHAFEREL